MCPTYVWQCPTCDIEREVITTVADRNRQEVCKCQRLMARVIVPAHVAPDIAPYMAVGGDRAGKMITSRKEHREFLKRNRLIEVGNEPLKPTRNNFAPRKGEIAQELKRVVPTVLNRG